MTGVRLDQMNRLVLRGTIAVLTVPIAALVLAGAVVVGTMVMNNLRLSEWKKDLFELQPPAGAEVAAKGTDFGLLGGNSNHCDKRAWVLLRTSASADDVERYYAERLETSSVWISVSVRRGSEVRVDMFEPGAAAGWDPRCH